MGETSDQIEREIAETRSELGQNFNELERKVKDLGDWRRQFDQHTGTMLALAFGGGMIVSAFLPVRRRRKSYERPVDEQPPAKPSVDAHPARVSGTRESVRAFGDALLGVAANRLSGFVDSLLPGFEREFHRSRTSRYGNGEHTSGGGSPQTDWAQGG